jgi:membrane protease YdiL (CAAX protease family)
VPRVTELLLFILGAIILVPLLQSYLYIQMYLIDLLADNWGLFRSVKDLLDSYNKIVEDAYNTVIITNTLSESLLVVFIVSVVPAFCEEFLFRGFVQSSFEFRLKPVYAALITAVFFGIFHFNPYGIIPLIALGFYFGYAAYLSNSIFVPVALHFLNNLTAVVLFFIIGNDDLLKSAPSDDVDIPSALTALFLLSVLFAGAVFLIKNYYSGRSQTVKAESGNFKDNL